MKKSSIALLTVLAVLYCFCSCATSDTQMSVPSLFKEKTNPVAETADSGIERAEIIVEDEKEEVVRSIEEVVHEETEKVSEKTEEIVKTTEEIIADLKEQLTDAYDHAVEEIPQIEQAAEQTVRDIGAEIAKKLNESASVEKVEKKPEPVIEEVAKAEPVVEDEKIQEPVKEEEVIPVITVVKKTEVPEVKVEMQEKPETAEELQQKNNAAIIIGCSVAVLTIGGIVYAVLSSKKRKKNIKG